MGMNVRVLVMYIHCGNIRIRADILQNLWECLGDHFVPPPTLVGAWSMALGLQRHLEYHSGTLALVI